MTDAKTAYKAGDFATLSPPLLALVARYKADELRQTIKHAEANSDDWFATMPAEVRAEWERDVEMFAAIAETIERAVAIRSVVEPDYPPTYRHNGHVTLITSPELSDVEVAGRIRMLTHFDLSAEALLKGKPPLEYWCLLARDRILHLSQRIAALIFDHDKRVTELLEANNREVERRRAAEAALEPFAAIANDRSLSSHPDIYAPRPSRGRPNMGDFRRARAALTDEPAPHGPFGWLICPIGLAEDEWHLEDDPSESPEDISIPLYARSLPDEIAKQLNGGAG